MKQTTMKRKGLMTTLALCALVAGIAARGAAHGKIPLLRMSS